MSNPQNSLVTTRKRLLIVILSITFLFCALCSRLAYIQIFQGKDLQSKASEQWYRDLPLQAPRGKILDTNGEVLVDNKDVFTVYVRPRAVKDAIMVAKNLSQTLELDEAKLFEKISTSKVSEITIKRGVDKEKANSLRALDMTGVYFTMDSKRNYPNSSFMTQILGYTNADNVGQNGLEGYYDKYLKGVNGFSYTGTDIQGNELGNNITSYVPAIAGCDMNLSVDSQIQSFAESAVIGASAEWGSKSASMVVMDCKTGGVLAMATAPAFDLNNPPRNDIDMLNALSKNKMIVDVYEPGSTFKIFTTATAVENGAVGNNDRFYCPGYRVVDGQRIKCWRSIGHGSQNLAEGVMNSCNCVFMDLALRLGTDKLYKGIKDFGFGSTTKIDFFGESRGLLMPQKSVKNVDLARIGFGQAVAVTPLQLVTGVSAVVNGGKLYEPYFVSDIKASSGEKIFTRDKKLVRNVVSNATSEKMREYLEAVVSTGSGKKAQVPGFRIGGKTGTAQKYENGHIAQGKYVSSFVGFAPANDPQYVVLMIVDEPTSYAYYGSILAAPYAGQVFKKIFDYKGIKPTSSETVKYIDMPHLDGKSLSESIAILKQLGLQYELVGESGKVISTLPAPLTKIPEGDIVLLRLEG